MNRALWVLCWAATIGAAFWGGRASVDSERSQNELAVASPGNSSVLPGISASSTPGGDSGKGIEGEATAGKPSVKAMVAAARMQLQGQGASFMNLSAMMKVMAPFSELSPEEIREALDEIDSTIQAPQQKMMLLSVLLGRLAETDGPAAIAYAEEHLGTLGPMGQGAKMSAMASWAQSDPAAAWNYYLKEKENGDPGLGPMGGSGMMLAPLFNTMASQDLDAALERLGTLEDGEKMMAINGLTQAAVWDEDRRYTLLAATEDMEESSKRQFRQQLVSQWAMMDAEKALEWVADVEDDQRGHLLQAVSGPLMMTNPQKGAEVLLENAPEGDRPGVYAQIVSQWANQDANAAGEWLGQQPQSAELDQARMRFSQQVSSRDPESAMAWAGTIEDANIRFQAISNTYRRWSRTDAEAANAAIESVELSVEQRQQLQGQGRTP